jgi:c-di-GMP-binding flagellar brake protein YcgR
MFKKYLKKYKEYDDTGDMGFFLESGNNVSRAAYRVNVEGISARTPKGDIFALRDLSFTGMGLNAKLPTSAEGTVVLMDILISDKLYISHVKCKIVRCMSDGVVACQFVDVSHAIEVKLDKLVLELQKRRIAEKQS